MSRGPDAGTLLARALEGCGPHVDVIRRTSTRWASATFTGARHEIMLEGPADALLDSWLTDLPEAAFDLRGHLLADIGVIRVTRAEGRATIAIEALTVES